MAYDPGTKTLTQIIADIKEWSRYTVADGEWLNDHDILPIKAALSKMASGTVNWPSGGSNGQVLTLIDSANTTVAWRDGGSGGANYKAGKWISSTSLIENNTIECSGYRNVYAVEPLYFEEAPAGGSYPNGSVLLKTNDAGGGGDISRSWALYNYVSGQAEKSESSNDNAIKITPPSDRQFHKVENPFKISFTLPMTVAVNISAKFVPKSNVKDMYGNVGFGGTAVTNNIIYSMLGIEPQTYAISTITNVPQADVEIPFQIIANEDFIEKIDQLTLSIYRIA